MRMLFEVKDLAVASPATVSRCGMVYMNVEAVGWHPYMITWVNTKLSDWEPETREHIRGLFENHV
jgi:dynein heavy chain